MQLSGTHNQEKNKLKKTLTAFFTEELTQQAKLNFCKKKMKYLIPMKLNANENKIIGKYSLEKDKSLESEKGVHGIKIVTLSSIKYYLLLEMWTE